MESKYQSLSRLEYGVRVEGLILPQVFAVSAVGLKCWRRLGEDVHGDLTHQLLITAQQSPGPGSTGDQEIQLSGKTVNID